MPKAKAKAKANQPQRARNVHVKRTIASQSGFHQACSFSKKKKKKKKGLFVFDVCVNGWSMAANSREVVAFCGSVSRYTHCRLLLRWLLGTCSRLRSSSLSATVASIPFLPRYVSRLQLHCIIEKARASKSARGVSKLSLPPNTEFAQHPIVMLDRESPLTIMPFSTPLFEVSSRVFVSPTPMFYSNVIPHSIGRMQ